MEMMNYENDPLPVHQFNSLRVLVVVRNSSLTQPVSRTERKLTRLARETERYQWTAKNVRNRQSASILNTVYTGFLRDLPLTTFRRANYSPVWNQNNR